MDKVEEDQLREIIRVQKEMLQRMKEEMKILEKKEFIQKTKRKNKLKEIEKIAQSEDIYKIVKIEAITRKMLEELEAESWSTDY